MAQKTMDDLRREFGVGLLLVEAWVFAVVAFACLPRGQGFWLYFLPYALLIPPLGFLYASVSRWMGVVAGFVILMSASLFGLVLRPTVTRWMVETLLRGR